MIRKDLVLSKETKVGKPRCIILRGWAFEVEQGMQPSKEPIPGRSWNCRLPWALQLLHLCGSSGPPPGMGWTVAHWQDSCQAQNLGFHPSTRKIKSRSQSSLRPTVQCGRCPVEFRCWSEAMEHRVLSCFPPWLGHYLPSSLLPFSSLLTLRKSCLF